MRKLTQRGLFLLIICTLTVSCKKENNSLQGYIDADYTYISSNFAGNLISLDASKGTIVHKGDKLFTLDVQPQKSQLNRAQANLTQAMAQVEVKQAELDYQSQLLTRYQRLVKSGGVSLEELEEVKNNYLNAKASLISQQALVESSRADLTEAKWNKSNKEVYSSISGYVYNTYFTVGELVLSGRPVLSIVAPENLKVVFYVPEPLLAQLKLNNQVTISCDGCKENYPATINYISSKTEYTPPYIFSESSRSKFVYRVEAKPIKTAFNNLHPGQPVSINLIF
ncbi:hemolysin D [Legionella cherrii]|uniref:Hemolysin D n=1 Tax=Legionella cherrii TaxID=28084 RepID=A0A0W0S4S9_9GAMM|nr:hemolysin D [Legionella cherrii]VEB35093.1 hemolysin D [Legionella cherrii]